MHVKKNVARRLRKLKGWHEWKSRLRNLLDESPDDGDKRLMMMDREVREYPAPRLLAVDLLAKWRSLLRHKRMRGVCDTNNVTEQVIRRSKIRYKTIRGYKSVEGMINGLWLTQRIWGERQMWTWAICWPRSVWTMRDKPNRGHHQPILIPPTKRRTITRRSSCFTNARMAQYHHRPRKRPLPQRLSDWRALQPKNPPALGKFSHSPI